MKVDAGKIVELVRKMKPLFADSSRVSQVKEKGTCDYVTQVDIQVQKLVKEGLYSMYPQVQFMGEEQDNSAIDRSGDFWILDPVDGTTNLIHDFRHSHATIFCCFICFFTLILLMFLRYLSCFYCIYGLCHTKMVDKYGFVISFT